MMGGFWAPELKHAGYDKVIIRGRSPELVYLWIHNDKVEIRDAAHLRGKGAIETAECIRQELKEPNAQVAAIGLAGENRFLRVDRAGPIQRQPGGIGAVMGDKGLKAVVVRGTKDVNVARPAEFMKLCDEALQYIKFRADHPIPGVPAILTGLGSPQEMASSTSSGIPPASCGAMRAPGARTSGPMRLKTSGASRRRTCARA